MYAGAEFVGRAEKEVARACKNRGGCVCHSAALSLGIVHGRLFRCAVPVAVKEPVLVKVGEGVVIYVGVKVGPVREALRVAGYPAAEFGIVVPPAEVDQAGRVAALAGKKPGIVVGAVIGADHRYFENDGPKIAFNA